MPRPTLTVIVHSKEIFGKLQIPYYRKNDRFKVGDRVYFKNKTPGKWDLKWRAGYRIIWIECEGRYLHIKNQATGKI